MAPHNVKFNCTSNSKGFIRDCVSSESEEKVLRHVKCKFSFVLQNFRQSAFVKFNYNVNGDKKVFCLYGDNIIKLHARRVVIFYVSAFSSRFISALSPFSLLQRSAIKVKRM